MIDELVKVADAIKSAGISTYDWHPALKTLPKATDKKPCFRIWLLDDGSVVDIEPLSCKLAQELRKYEPDLGSSLPGFNLYPLLVTTTDKTEALNKVLAGDESFFSFDDNDNWKETRAKLTKCFGKVCFHKLTLACSAGLNSDETLSAFFKAIGKMTAENFQKQLLAVLIRKIESGAESGDAFLSLLFRFSDAMKRKNEAKHSVSVFLDMKHYKGYPVASKETMEQLNELLWGSQTSEISVETVVEPDAYGANATGKDELFPPVTLPVLGGIKLRSQVATIPAQQRYGFCESKTFPVGEEMRKAAKSALEWLSSQKDGRDGETYGQAGECELLFAYPRVLPKDRIPLAKLFGAQPDENLKADKFERLSASVIDQLRGSGRSVADAELEIFSLRKMDKARTKVVYYRNATVASLERASAAWHEGCQNIPSLDVRDWSEKKDGKTGKSHPVSVECETVFPVKLHRSLNTVWKRDGEQAGKVKIFEPADGLRLLLEEPCDALASHMMERFVQHAQGYFISLCRTQCRIDKKTGFLEISKLPDKIYYPGILGLLLFKSGKRKDEYMSESAVQLGRCLRVADEVHRLYCEVVRKKELPSELCGSSLLVSMMESPGMTLNQLAMRSAPYVKWARSFHDAEKGGLVHYWMRQWSDIANPLLEKGWPKCLTPDERAQVFLGYLSSFPKSEKVNSNNQIDSNNN